MSAIITLTTDFGADSPYVAQMKAVLLGNTKPRATIVDITHSIPPQDIGAGSAVLCDCCFRFPRGAIHIAVVDPGVGSNRAIAACRIGGHLFVGPDNGLLTPLTEDHALEEAVRLDLSKFGKISATFHGRDVMAPAAARIASGCELASLGPPVSLSPAPQPLLLTVEEYEIRGQVQFVDSFGNLITNIGADMIPNDRPLSLAVGDQSLDGLQSHYAAANPGDLIALIGSNSQLEFAIVNGSAARRLGLQRGAPVRVVWE